MDTLNNLTEDQIKAIVKEAVEQSLARQFEEMETRKREEELEKRMKRALFKIIVSDTLMSLTFIAGFWYVNSLVVSLNKNLNKKLGHAE